MMWFIMTVVLMVVKCVESGCAVNIPSAISQSDPENDNDDNDDDGGG